MSENQKKLKKILDDAIDIERWAPKSNKTYSFIDDGEREEIVENILKALKNNGYKLCSLK